MAVKPTDNLGKDVKEKKINEKIEKVKQRKNKKAKNEKKIVPANVEKMDEIDDDKVNNKQKAEPSIGKKKKNLSAIPEVSAEIPRKKAKIQKLIDEEEEEIHSDSESNSSFEEKRPTKKKNNRGSKLEEERTVFVGNLPLGATRRDIQKLFTSCGNVDSVRLRSAVPKEEKMKKRTAVIKRQFSDETKDSINAYVKFIDKADVKNAMKINGTIFGGHHLQVDSCQKDKKYDSKRSIFIGNLSFSLNEEQLINHFTDCGEVERVRIVRDKITGQGKGFGFVVFKDQISVDLALKLNGESLNERKLRISRVMKKFKKNQKGDKKSNNSETVDEKSTRSAKKFANKFKNKKNTAKSLMS